MLVNTNEGFLHSSGNFEKSNFTIKASSKAFSILSSALYQNKIRAIVRELSCNAIDAQKVNNSTKKFILQLPTHGTPTFRIRDFGPGISPEDIESVYTTYFESTKTMSNDMIGCLGLGSKTPFCYTDNFMVNSYHGGVKRSYAAAINEEGMPIISLVQEMPTSELSGLEVSFAVKTTDISAFLEEAQFVCYWLSDKPQIVGRMQSEVDNWLDVNLVRTLVSGSNWKIISGDYYVRNKPIFRPFVVMGNVPYALSHDNIPNLTPEEKAVLNSAIHIVVPIGSVEPQASRESLSYTKTTIAFLQRTLRDIVAEIKQERQLEIDKCKTYYDALCLHEKLSKHGNEEPFNTIFKKFEFNNKSVHFPVSLAPFNGKLNYSRGLQKSRRYGRGGNSDTIVIKQIDERSLYGNISNITFVSDESLATHPKGEDRARLIVKNWLLENPDLSTDSKVFFIEKPLADNLELIDGETIFDYNKLPAYSKPAIPRVKASQAGRIGKKKSEVWVVDNFDEAAEEKVEVDLEDKTTEFVYVLLENKKLPVLANLGYGWADLANYLLFFVGKSVVGLTTRQVAEISSLPNWKELRVAAKEEMIKVLANPKEIVESFEKIVCINQYASDLLKDSDVLKMVAVLKSNNPNHEIIQFTNKYKMTPAYSGGDKISNFYSRMDRHLKNTNPPKGTLAATALGSDFQFWVDSYAEFTKIRDKVVETCAKNRDVFAQDESNLLAKFPIFNSVMAANGIDDFLLKEICTKCL